MCAHEYTVSIIRSAFQRLIVPLVSLNASKRTVSHTSGNVRVTSVLASSSWSPITPLSPSRSFGSDICNRLSPQTHPAFLSSRAGVDGGVMFTFQLSNVSLCAIISICII